jgi:hypothetical protein
MRGRVNKYELGGRGNEHPWVDRLFGRDDPHRWRHDVGQLHRPSAGHAAASEGRISTAMMARARSVRGADQSANWHIEIEATGSTSAGRCGVRPVRCSTVSRISPARSIANNPPLDQQRRACRALGVVLVSEWIAEQTHQPSPSFFATWPPISATALEAASR